jgi:hypothetical protein
MTLFLLVVVILAIGLVLAHELGVAERAAHSSDELAERQRRARMEQEL